MVRRYGWVLVLVSLATAQVGCRAVSGDSWAALPASIAGEELVYNTAQGAQADDWAQAVLATTDAAQSSVTSATAFTAPDENEYQSYVVRIAGANGQQLIGPLIEAMSVGGPAETWQEDIAGKTVTRWLPCCEVDRRSAMYAYAFDDIAIVFLTRRPKEAEEALRALP